MLQIVLLALGFLSVLIRAQGYFNCYCGDFGAAYDYRGACRNQALSKGCTDGSMACVTAYTEQLGPPSPLGLSISDAWGVAVPLIDCYKGCGVGPDGSPFDESLAGCHNACIEVYNEAVIALFYGLGDCECSLSQQGYCHDLPPIPTPQPHPTPSPTIPTVTSSDLPPDPTSICDSINGMANKCGNINTLTAAYGAFCPIQGAETALESVAANWGQLLGLATSSAESVVNYFVEKTGDNRFALAVGLTAAVAALAVSLAVDAEVLAAAGELYAAVCEGVSAAGAMTGICASFLNLVSRLSCGGFRRRNLDGPTEHSVFQNFNKRTNTTSRNNPCTTMLAQFPLDCSALAFLPTGYDCESITNLAVPTTGEVAINNSTVQAGRAECWQLVGMTTKLTQMCSIYSAIAAYEPYCMDVIPAPLTTSGVSKTSTTLSSTSSTSNKGTTTVLATIPASTTTTTTSAPTTTSKKSACPFVPEVTTMCSWAEEISSSVSNFCLVSTSNSSNLLPQFDALIKGVIDLSNLVTSPSVQVVQGPLNLSTRVSLATALLAGATSTDALTTNLNSLYSSLCSVKSEFEKSTTSCSALTVAMSQYGCTSPTRVKRGGDINLNLPQSTLPSKAQRLYPRGFPMDLSSKLGPRSVSLSSNPCQNLLQYATFDCDPFDPSFSDSQCYIANDLFYGLSHITPFEGDPLLSVVADACSTTGPLYSQRTTTNALCTFYAAVEAFGPYCDTTQYSFTGLTTAPPSSTRASFSQRTSSTASTSASLSSSPPTTAATTSSSSSSLRSSTSTSKVLTSTKKSVPSPSTTALSATSVKSTSTTTSSNFLSSATGAPVTKTGACGASHGGQTCLGGTFGNCCSQYGYCGTDIAHCGSGCHPQFGLCGVPIVQSKDGFCGVKHRTTCAGTKWGACCSANGRCGNGSKFCGKGCFSKYGACN